MAKAMKGNKVIVDFTGVESGGGRVRVPEDDYRFKVDAVKLETSKQGLPMLVWEVSISAGKFKGKKFWERTSLSDKALWRLKNLLEAMGVEVPSKKVALDINRYVGMEFGGTVTDEEYEGKISSRISDYVSLEVLDEADDDEEEPKPKKSKKDKKGKKAVSDEEDDEEIEDIDLDEI